MAQPKKQLSHARSGNRRSHLALATKAVATCPKCHAAIAPHTVCAACGTYRGRQVVKPATAHASTK